MVLVGGFYYLRTQKAKNDTISSVSLSPTLTQIDSQTPIITKSQSNSISYRTRYFDVDDLFYNKEKYPLELTSIYENALTPISCTGVYTNDSGKGDYTVYEEFPQNQRSASVEEESDMMSYIKNLNVNSEGKHVSEIISCTPKVGKVIVLYSMGPCGGGCMGIPYVGVVNGTSIQQIAEIKNVTAYYGCRKPLQLTNTNNFYFVCSGGDGPGGAATIYKMLLNSKALTTVRSCESGIDASDNPYTKCK